MVSCPVGRERGQQSENTRRHGYGGSRRAPRGNVSDAARRRAAQGHICEVSGEDADLESIRGPMGKADRVRRA
ncbi:hypothetical protein SKAU_G00342600 [Synaphobranchus kaupii]|uniref:Uncharacterized protein n=1 Tax=Synaphobranchus kaupii TaxID=118154 RepID=A0A9Q1EIW3_SYNKA|nr:hypothetical protein SKAU_G00342600 [Synaphobranchus kaupii]